MPPGVYFSGDFTFIAWIKINSFVINGRIFDFGNGAGSDNILIHFSGVYLKVFVFSSNKQSYFTNSVLALKLNVWYHTALDYNFYCILTKKGWSTPNDFNQSLYSILPNVDLTEEQKKSTETCFKSTS